MIEKLIAFRVPPHAQEGDDDVDEGYLDL